MKKLLSLLLVAAMLLVIMPSTLALGTQDYDPVGDSFAAVNAPYLTSGGGSSTTNFLTAADFAANTITILNVWDRYCGYCTQEMPYFQQIHEQYASQGVLVVAVATTWMGATYAQDYTYFVNNGYTYMHVKIDTAIQNIASNNNYIPQTYILDSTGRCIDYIGGGTTYSVLKQKVDTYLAQYAPTYYNVTFKDGLTGGTIATVSVKEGQAAVAPAAPAHEGYEFVGWDKDFSSVHSNMTVTALYEATVSTLSGDVDCDGLITFGDITMLSMNLAGIAPLAGQGLVNADMDGDGIVGFSDVSAIYIFLIS